MRDVQSVVHHLLEHCAMHTVAFTCGFLVVAVVGYLPPLGISQHEASQIVAVTLTSSILCSRTPISRRRVHPTLFGAPRRTRVDMGTIQPVHVGHVLIASPAHGRPNANATEHPSR